MNCRANALVGSAAANVARHSRVDILIARILVFFQQGDSLHDLSSLAVAALRDSNLHPCLLHWMHGCNAFNRCDFGASNLADGSSTRADCRAVLMHRARSA